MQSTADIFVEDSEYCIMDKEKITEIYNKAWGQEHWIINKDYCGKRLVINRGFRSSLHYHKEKEETLYCLSGRVLMEVADKTFLLNPGEKVNIPPGIRHRFSGLEQSEIFEFASHHKQEDNYRDSHSEKIPDSEFTKICEAYG